MSKLSTYVQAHPGLEERATSFAKRIRIISVTATLTASNFPNQPRLSWDIRHHIEVDEIQHDVLAPVLRISEDTADKFNYLTQSWDLHTDQIWLPVSMREIPIGPEIQKAKTTLWNEAQDKIMGAHNLSWLHYGTSLTYSLNLSALAVFPPESIAFLNKSGDASDLPRCAYAASVWPYVADDGGEAESLVGLIPPTFQIAPPAGQKVGVPLVGSEEAIEKFLNDVKYAYGCAYALAST
jgi:hypothetical protein